MGKLFEWLNERIKDALWDRVSGLIVIFLMSRCVTEGKMWWLLDVIVSVALQLEPMGCSVIAHCLIRTTLRSPSSHYHILDKALTNYRSSLVHKFNTVCNVLDYLHVNKPVIPLPGSVTPLKLGAFQYDMPPFHRKFLSFKDAYNCSNRTGLLMYLSGFSKGCK